MPKKENTLKLLTNTQKKQVSDLFKHYKFIYICSFCGSIYGSDKREKSRICPICESKLLRRKKNKEGGKVENE